MDHAICIGVQTTQPVHAEFCLLMPDVWILPSCSPCLASPSRASKH